MIPDLQSVVGGRHLKFAFNPFDGQMEADFAALNDEPQAKVQWLLEKLAYVFSVGGETVGLGALTLSEFDAALAHLYRTLYGNQACCEASCEACGEGYEFTLDLETMQTSLGQQVAAMQIVDGIATDPDSGRRFRLPTVGDLAELERKGAERWMRQLLLEGEFTPDLEDEIERAAPMLTQDITAKCPECETENRVRFDLARYLVQTLGNESAFLWREVHLIADRYGWPLGEILALSRPVRRQLANLIVSDRIAARTVA